MYRPTHAHDFCTDLKCGDVYTNPHKIHRGAVQACRKSENWKCAKLLVPGEHARSVGLTGPVRHSAAPFTPHIASPACSARFTRLITSHIGPFSRTNLDDAIHSQTMVLMSCTKTVRVASPCQPLFPDALTRKRAPGSITERHVARGKWANLVFKRADVLCQDNTHPSVRLYHRDGLE